MSADNFLGIYWSEDRREFIGRGCGATCQGDNCDNCSNLRYPIIFTARTESEAISKAEEATRRDLYKHGYCFLNIDDAPFEDSMMKSICKKLDAEICNLSDKKKEGKMAKFWLCRVEGTNGGIHYKHHTLAEAQKEAERLAKLPDVRGKKVHLFEWIGDCYVESSPVKWEIPRC